MNSNKHLEFLQQMANPQTPNSFLSSLPKLHMDEINQFESSFGKVQQQQVVQEVSPANEAMPSMDAQAPAAASASSQQQQQMMDSIAAAFNHSSSQQMMLPMTPDSFSMQTPPMHNVFSPQTQCKIHSLF